LLSTGPGPAGCQLALFEPSPRLVTASDGVPLEPVLAGWLEAELAVWGTLRGWTRSTLARGRGACGSLLAIQDTPGGPLSAGLFQQLSGKNLASRLLREFLTAHGFLEDDLPQTIEVWFTRTTASLPEVMTRQLAHWFTTRLHGRIDPPRSLARSPATMRHHLQFALPVLTRLAATGLSDLTHVSATQLRRELDACRLTGNDIAAALRHTSRDPQRPLTALGLT
jgi:hypothetical protein